MRGVGVPQRVDVSAFDDARFLPSTVEGALEAGIGDGADVMGQTPSQPATGRRREEPLWRTVRFPKLPQQFQSPFWKWNVTVLLAFPVDVQNHPRAIDIFNPKVCAFQ